MEQYEKYKDRYSNLDNFAESFLTSAYSGSTTWNTVIKEVFEDPEVVIEPNDDVTENGYKITISGTYYPNAVDLKGIYSEEGTLVLYVSADDVSNVVRGSEEQSEAIINAFNVYISLGTAWYY